jgi:hypothetical protein
MSDTTSAAGAVSNHVDGTEHIECEMHILNLIMLYGIGLHANLKTERTVGDDGIERRVQSEVTQGSLYPDGACVIWVLRDICKYFSSPQKLDSLGRCKFQIIFHLVSHYSMTRPMWPAVTNSFSLLSFAKAHSSITTNLSHSPNNEFNQLWTALIKVNEFF